MIKVASIVYIYKAVFGAPQLADKLAYFSSFFMLSCLVSQKVAYKLAF